MFGRGGQAQRGVRADKKITPAPRLKHDSNPNSGTKGPLPLPYFNKRSIARPHNTMEKWVLCGDSSLTQ